MISLGAFALSLGTCIGLLNFECHFVFPVSGCQQSVIGSLKIYRVFLVISNGSFSLFSLSIVHISLIFVASSV